jgi:hypothetical protein
MVYAIIELDRRRLVVILQICGAGSIIAEAMARRPPVASTLSSSKEHDRQRRFCWHKLRHSNQNEQPETAGTITPRTGATIDPEAYWRGGKGAEVWWESLSAVLNGGEDYVAALFAARVARAFAKISARFFTPSTALSPEMGVRPDAAVLGGEGAQEAVQPAGENMPRTDHRGCWQRS